MSPQLYMDPPIPSASNFKAPGSGSETFLGKTSALQISWCIEMAIFVWSIPLSIVKHICKLPTANCESRTSTYDIHIIAITLYIYYMYTRKWLYVYIHPLIFNPSQAAKNIPMPPWIGTEQQLLQLSRSEKLCVFTDTVVLVCDKVERFSWIFCSSRRKSINNTVDGRNPKQPPGTWQKTSK